MASRKTKALFDLEQEIKTEVILKRKQKKRVRNTKGKNIIKKQNK